jgi:hypothetical protein
MGISFAVLQVSADAGPDGGADGGADGGDTDTDTDSDIDTDTDADTDSDTDTGPAFCELVTDPCCLDNGSDDDVLELFGCNGPPKGPAEVGALGGLCTYDPDDEDGLGNCVGITQCWNYKKWHSPSVPGEVGDCGLCLELCYDFINCPDGENDIYSYDFCTSSCPEGMRCWVYTFNDNKRGLCMMDCEDDEDCSEDASCAPEWNVCVPDPGICPDPGDTDTETDTSTDTWEDGDGGFPDGGEPSGPDEGGCACSTSGSRGAASLLGLVLDSTIS